MVRATGQARSGFTLTELLVVIFIIVTLLGILLPAIQLVKVRGQVAQAQNDIMQMSTAIGTFKTTYNVHFVPSYFQLKQTYNPNDPTGMDQVYLGYLKSVWPRLQDYDNNAANGFNLSIQPLGQPQINLDGNQCLVFFLGGFVNFNNQAETGLGFATSSTNPFASTTTNRQAAFMTFQKERLTGLVPPTGLPGPNLYPKFLDPWGNEYLYFTAVNGNDYDVALNKDVTLPTPTVNNALNFTGYVPAAGQPVNPFIEARQPLKFYNPHTFQIISAGQDGFGRPNNKRYYGYGGDGTKDLSSGSVPPNTPGMGLSPYQPAFEDYATGRPGHDDLTNFRDRQMGAP